MVPAENISSGAPTGFSSRSTRCTARPAHRGSGSRRNPAEPHRTAFVSDDRSCRSGRARGSATISPTSSLLRRALTHGSVSGGTSSGTRARDDYQRLEFLGDRVLGCVVAAWLYRDYDEPEGQTDGPLSWLGRRASLNAEVARALDVPKQLFMEKVARQKGLGHSDNVLGDIAEAIVAAIFLDGGWSAADAFVRRHWGALLDAGPRLLIDPKVAFAGVGARQKPPGSYLRTCRAHRAPTMRPASGSASSFAGKSR